MAASTLRAQGDAGPLTGRAAVVAVLHRGIRLQRLREKSAGPVAVSGSSST
jgi:hypothetical protein